MTQPDTAACDGCGFKVCPVLGQPCCDHCTHAIPASAAPTPGAITLLRDGVALVAQGDATRAEWTDWGARVEWFLLDYDAAVAAIKAERKAVLGYE